MTLSFPVAGFRAGRSAVGIWPGLWGPVWVVGLVALLITGCAGPGSGADQETVGAENETSEETSGAGSTSGGAMVNWDEGLTQQEQLAEVEFVVSVMKDHFGEDIMRAENWTLEGFAGLKGNPRASHRASDHYFYRVRFDLSDVEANQETQEKALAVLEEIGLTPNGEQPSTYDEDRRLPLYVAGGEENNGRLFLVEQLNPPDGEIKALFTTRHSDHQSMHETHEASWED